MSDKAPIGSLSLIIVKFLKIVKIFNKIYLKKYLTIPFSLLILIKIALRLTICPLPQLKK
jgi:hypothetical protein